MKQRPKWFRFCHTKGDIDDHIEGHPELKNDADLIATIPRIGVIKSGQPFDMKKAMPTLDFQDGN